MRPHRGILLSNALILSGLLLLWSWAVQSFSSYQRFAIDTLVLLSVFLLILFGLRLRRRTGGRWAPAVFAAVGAWLILSALEPVTDRPLQRDPARFSRAFRVATDCDCSLTTGSHWRAERVGVALSGGGFRAAAFHAGVLHTLDRLGVPVTNVSTISGGSIIGAFYTLGGDPLDFVEALAQGSFNLRRHLALAQNLLRLPSSRFSRLTAQADFLRRRLALADAERIRSNCGDCPRLVLGTTDLNFDMQVGFLDKGLLLVNEADYWCQHHPDAAGLDGLDLATQVAISGAFPGAFPPYPLEITTPRQASNPPGPPTIRRALVLGDGGILDNTGLLLLRTAQQQSKRPPASLSGWNVEVIVVSDAGALFGLGGDPGILASLQRSVDVLSARGSQGFKRREISKLDLVWVSPQSNFTSILFDAPVEQLSPEALIKVEQYRIAYWSSPFRLPDVILKALGDVLLEGDESAIKEFEAFLEKRKARSGSPGTARDEARWRETFRSELIRLSLVFRDTSTLRDQLGPGTTGDLFALGQAQTLLNWKILWNRLNRDESRPDILSDPCEPPKRQRSAGENGTPGPEPPPSRRGPGGAPPPQT